MRQRNYFFIFPVMIALMLFSNVNGLIFADDEKEDLVKQIKALESRINFLEKERLGTRRNHFIPLTNRQMRLWDLLNEIDRQQFQFDTIFNDTFTGRMGFDDFFQDFGNESFKPEVDIKEKKDCYIAKIDLPGMDKSKINISVEDTLLVISGDKEKVVQEDEKGKFFRQERSYGHFLRTFPLPDDAKKDDISAEYKKGVLTVKIPRVLQKEKKKKKSKKIKIF